MRGGIRRTRAHKDERGVVDQIIDNAPIYMANEPPVYVGDVPVKGDAGFAVGTHLAGCK